MTVTEPDVSAKIVSSMVSAVIAQRACECGLSSGGRRVRRHLHGLSVLMDSRTSAL